jgi:hypothetical protein
VEEEKRRQAAVERTLAAPSPSASRADTLPGLFASIIGKMTTEGCAYVLCNCLQVGTFPMSTDFHCKRYNRCGLEGAKLRTGGILTL